MECDSFSDFIFNTFSGQRRTGQVFCRRALNLGFSGFSMIRLGLWDLGRKTTEVKYPACHITSGIHVVSMAYHWWCSLDHLAEMVFAGLLAVMSLTGSRCVCAHMCACTPPHILPSCPFWKESLSTALLKGGQLCSTSSEGEEPRTWFGIQDICLSLPPYIYLFNHLFV